jgi:hypothetical protein
MTTPLDTLLAQVKNKLSSAAQFIKSNSTPNAYLSQQFQKNVAQPVAQKIANTPVLPFMNVTPKSYVQGQVINPIKQGVQQIQQPGLLNKSLGAMQLFGGVSAVTPIGALSNIAQGAIGGVGQAVREKKNPLATIAQGINTPTSVATTGLGITNPYMALAVDVLSPSAANRGVKIAQAKGLLNVPGLSKIEGALADSKGFFDSIASTFESGVSGADRKKVITELAQEAKRHAAIFEMSPKEIEQAVTSSPEGWIKKLQEKSTLFLADRARATSYGLKTNVINNKPSTGGEKGGIPKVRSYDPNNLPVSVQKLKEEILLNSDSNISSSAIEAKLKEGGSSYIKTKIDPNTLKIQDADLLKPQNTLQEGYKPIVVGKDGFIIDGRNRALSAKKQGVLIDAYVPSSGEIPKGVPEGKAKFKQPIKVPEQPRGFTESVQQAGNIPKRVKGMVQNVYTQKPNTKLMGEAQALLQEGASLDITKVQNVDQKIAATIQEAINQQRKNPDLAANLYNNLARQGTELGRGVQAFSLLQKMTPEAIAKSAAGKIQEYNRTAVRKIPELTGDQLKMITSKVDAIKKLTVGSREHNIAVNELSNTINQFIPSSIADKAITVWKAGLLTSLRTTERNLFGNSIHAIVETVKDLPATMADMLMSMATGKRTVTFTTKGVSEGWSKKTAQQISDTIKLGYDATEDISKFDHKRITWGNTPLEKGLKVYTDAVFRSLGAQDKPFYNAAFKRSLFSQAGAEAINVGRGGDRSFIQSLVNKPTEDMLKIAMSDANVATFKDKNSASKVVNAIKQELSKVKLGEFEVGKLISEITMPFTGVPSSILGQIASYSPIGLLKGIVNTGKVVASQVPDLQRQAAQEIGRGVVGTGIFSLGAYLASKGMITGQPKDPEEQRQWDLENKPRNSIMIGGKWRSLNSIGPEAVVFLAGAKLNEEMNNPEGSIGAYAGKLGKDYLDQSFVQGLQAPVNAITDPGRYGKSYVGNLSSSFVPNIVKDTSKSLDGTQRETNTIPDYVKSAIPGVRNTLIEKRDTLGNVMKQEPTGLGAFFDLFNSKTPIDNTVVSELGRLQREGEGATPSKLTPQQTILKQKVKLTFDQLNQLEQGVGEIVRPRLETLVSSEVYKSLDDEHKAKAIDSIVQDARLKYKNINAKTLTGAGLDPNQYLDINGNLKTVSTEPIPQPTLTGNKTIDDKLKAQYKSAVENQQMEQYKLSNQSTPDIGKKTYDYIDENGNYKTIDLTPISFPKLTGNEIVDKKLKSAYYSSINSQINDVIKLGQAGQITEKEMIDMVSTLNAQYTKGKGKKVAGLSPTFKTRKVPKLKALKVKKPKKIKVPKLAKIKPITYKKLKAK